MRSILPSSRYGVKHAFASGERWQARLHLRPEPGERRIVVAPLVPDHVDLQVVDGEGQRTDGQPEQGRVAGRGPRVDGCHHRRLRRHGQQRQHVVRRMHDLRPAFSMAATGRRRDLYLYDLAGGSLHRVGRGEGTYANPAWSPDGTRLYFTSARYVNPVPSGQENDFAMLKSTGINVIAMPADPARIDPASLMARAVAVPVAPANVVQLDARGDRLYYLTQPLALFNGVLPGERSALHASASTFDRCDASSSMQRDPAMAPLSFNALAAA
ncbi:conserved hypothetical protein [Ricinus communis]|uniref:Protein tolB n=1 Tax=Ricinus communis TaxID=3988 RepID=B9THZ2_RICCO|nr:conserved hypothetical protein [Ricinus communis]